MCAIGMMLGSDKEKIIKKNICYMIMEEIIFECTSDLSNQFVTKHVEELNLHTLIRKCPSKENVNNQVYEIIRISK